MGWVTLLQNKKCFRWGSLKSRKAFSCNTAGSSELNLQRSLLKRHFTYWSFLHLTSKNSGCWHRCFIQLLYFVFCKEKVAPVSTTRLSLRVGGREFPPAYMNMTSWLLSSGTQENRTKSKQQGSHLRAGVRGRWFLPVNMSKTPWLLSQRKQWKIEPRAGVPGRWFLPANMRKIQWKIEPKFIPAFDIPAT